jgi:hypothetical protein
MNDEQPQAGPSRLPSPPDLAQSGETMTIPSTGTSTSSFPLHVSRPIRQPIATSQRITTVDRLTPPLLSPCAASPPLSFPPLTLPGLEFFEYRRHLFLAGLPLPSTPTTNLPTHYTVPLPLPSPLPPKPYHPTSSAVERLETLLAEPGAEETELAWRAGVGGVLGHLKGGKRLSKPLRLGLVVSRAVAPSHRHIIASSHNNRSHICDISFLPFAHRVLGSSCPLPKRNVS